VAVQVILRAERAEEPAENGEALVASIRQVVDVARRSVRDQDIQVAAIPQAVHQQLRQHPRDLLAHAGFGVLIGAMVVAQRSVEAADEEPLFLHHLGVELAHAPGPALDGLAARQARIVVAVHRVEGGAEHGGYVVEVVLGEVAAAEHQIDRSETAGYAGTVEAVVDLVADSEDAHRRVRGFASAFSYVRHESTRVACPAKCRIPGSMAHTSLHDASSMLAYADVGP
jgi:hypothetical protein